MSKTNIIDTCGVAAGYGQNRPSATLLTEEAQLHRESARTNASTTVALADASGFDS
jgi:hypothetical protein